MSLFKKKLKKNEQEQSREEMTIAEADAKLKRAKALANIANKTTNREKFYSSINEIKDIFRELIKYEDKLPFIGSPSADLRRLEQAEPKAVQALEERIMEINNYEHLEQNPEESSESFEENKPLLEMSIEPESDTNTGSDEFERTLEDRKIEKNFFSGLVIGKLETPAFEESRSFGEERDMYFGEAGRFIIEKERASIGMLQRVYKIGFNRAVHIMDQLCDAGVVGSEEGTKPRRVLMTLEEFEDYLRQGLGELTQNPKEKKKTEVEETPKDVQTILKENFGIEIDYSTDGQSLKKLKNVIVPSASNDVQIECINTLLKYNSPDTMRLFLIDDSVINYSMYNIVVPVITEVKRIDLLVDRCHAEMEDRINKFLKYSVKNIDSFNQKKEEAGENPLPRIIYVINEAKEFFDSISTPLERMLMNSNMVGIYFIFFSRFSLKRLSLGIIEELLEVLTFDKLRIMVSQTLNADNERYATRDFDNMDGYQFENFCAYALRKNGFQNVDITQRSGDHGIDILAEKDDITYAIQCKCYSSDIGNDAVQQAHTGKSLYHKDIAVVMTNRYFTSQAIEEAKALGVKLWDRDKLNKMIENVIL